MITGARKVLCPIEFDDTFSSALALAKMLVARNQGKLFLMHVVAPVNDPLLVAGSLKTHRDLVASERELKRLEARELSEIAHDLVLRVGDPAEEIIKAEAEYGIDLVVMPTHRHSQVFRLLADGVSERVVRDSICPVTTLSEKAWANARLVSQVA